MAAQQWPTDVMHAVRTEAGNAVRSGPVTPKLHATGLHVLHRPGAHQPHLQLIRPAVGWVTMQLWSWGTEALTRRKPAGTAGRGLNPRPCMLPLNTQV